MPSKTRSDIKNTDCMFETSINNLSRQTCLFWGNYIKVDSNVNITPLKIMQKLN